MQDLPTQKAFTKPQEAVFWKALKAVAYADGVLVEHEPTRLRDWAKRFNVPAEFPNPGRLDLAELTAAFPSPFERVVVFRALCDMATCDGDYHDEEDRLLDAIAEEWWPPVAPRAERFTVEQKQALWHALIVVAWADQDVTGVERHLLANWARRLDIPKDLEDTRPPSLAEAMGIFYQPEERQTVLRALYSFAIADGPLQENEKSLLESVARRWQMPLPV